MIVQVIKKGRKIDLRGKQRQLKEKKRERLKTHNTLTFTEIGCGYVNKWRFRSTFLHIRWGNRSIT